MILFWFHQTGGAGPAPSGDITNPVLQARLGLGL